MATLGRRRQAAGGYRRAAVAMALACVVALPTVGAWSATGAGAATPDPVVSLDSLIVDQPLPGFGAAPTGPTNGPLTATEFASQSADPTQAEQQFDALASRPGFGASIRLWTDRTGPGTGANDVVVLLFRIADPGEAAAFERGLYQPFDGASGSSPFSLPSVPGAHGTAMTVTTPVAATERVVVFGAGRYVAMVQLASSSASTNTDPLTAAQATTVSYEELTTLRTGDPTGSATAPPATTTTRPSTDRAPAATGRGGATSSTVPLLVGALVLVGLVAVVGAVLLRRRRRGRGAEPASVDPWGPGGLFEHFGARAGVAPSDPTGAAGAAGAAGDHAVPAPTRTAQAVPELDTTSDEVPVG